MKSAWKMLAVLLVTVAATAMPQAAHASTAMPQAAHASTAMPQAAHASTTSVAGVTAPAGSKIVGNWIVGSDGAQMSLTPMAYADCPSTWWCLYLDINWSGRMLKFGGEYHGNLSDWGFNDEMSSFRNNSSTDARWYEGPEGQWLNPCHNMPAYSASSSVQPNDSASSIYGGGLC